MVTFLTQSSKARMTKTLTKSDALRENILEAATRLFIERGFDGTSFNDIADAIGVSRPALYYYFKSKEAILEVLTETVTRAAGQLASEAVPEHMKHPAGILRHLVLRHAQLILTHPLQFRVVERNEGNLPPKQRKLAEQARRAVLEQFQHAIEYGIEQGQFCAMDAKVAAFSIIGMCNWSAWWYSPSGARSLEQVSEQVADMALRSVQLENARQLREPSAAEVIRLLRDDIDMLERHLGSGGPSRDAS